jgi:hypothetical protein
MFGAMATDVRALPNATLNLYLYPVGAWVVVFAALYFAGYPHFALPLCYPLALWQVLLSASWGRRLLQRLEAGQVTYSEAHAGVRSVGQLLVWSGLAPGIALLAEDPLAMSAWSAMAGAVAVSGLSWIGIAALTRVASAWTHLAAVALGCCVLPLNATGAVTVATLIGIFS